MTWLTKTMKLSKNEFETQQNEIRQAMFDLIEKYRKKYTQTYENVNVLYYVSLNKDPLQKQYKVVFSEDTFLKHGFFELTIILDVAEDI